MDCLAIHNPPEVLTVALNIDTLLSGYTTTFILNTLAYSAPGENIHMRMNTH